MLVDVNQLTKAIEQCTCHLKADLHALLITDIKQRPLNLLTHVPRNPIRGVRAVEWPLVDRHALREVVELRPEAFSDEPLVDPRSQLCHDATLRQAHDHVAPTQSRAGAIGVAPEGVLTPRREGFGARAGDSPTGTLRAGLARRSPILSRSRAGDPQKPPRHDHFHTRSCTDHLTSSCSCAGSVAGTTAGCRTSFAAAREWIAVDELAELIAASHARFLPRVVEAVFGTDHPLLVSDALTQAVGAALGVPVVGARFYEPGVGVVVGFEMSDGRSVVAKVHRASFTRFEHLVTIARVQADLAAAGVPAPRPVAGPLLLGDGWLTIEEHRGGESANGYDPAVRRGMASALHEFIDAARRHAGRGQLGTLLGEPVIDDLWPEPHDLRFDLPGTAAGAEWIDEAARAARAMLVATKLPDVVGHLDWRVQNLAFARSTVSAVYDWDSVGLGPEPAVVGSASVVHPIDWRLDLPDPLPTLDQLDAFVVDYEAARGATFDDQERKVLTAGQRWVATLGARRQHSDDVLGLFPNVDHSRGWPRLLHQLLER